MGAKIRLLKICRKEVSPQKSKDIQRQIKMLLIAIIIAIFLFSAIIMDASYLSDDMAATTEAMEKKYDACPKSAGEYSREINGMEINTNADAMMLPENILPIFRIKSLFICFIFLQKIEAVRFVRY